MKSQKLLSVIVALVLLSTTGWLIASTLRHSSKNDAELPAGSDEIGQEDMLQPDTDELESFVSFSEERCRLAGIQTQRVAPQDLQTTRTLPARFIYDQNRHVAVRAPTDGVLESVSVQPGNTVAVGDPVAVLRSPAIGVARNQILTSQSQLELAQTNLRWKSGVHEGVTRLAKLIRDGEPIEVIKKRIEEDTLGDFGGQLMSKYSQSLLADRVAQSSSQAGQSGAISGRLIEQRRNAKQQAEADLEATIEQSIFQARTGNDTALLAVEQASRDLRIAKQTLSTLLGATTEMTSELDISPNDPNVSKLTIRSPLAGTVERKVYSATERVTAQSELFVIADTSELWVEADMRSRDWDLIHVSAGDTVWVSMPVGDQRPQAAQVQFVGREADSASGSIPLVAKIANRDGRYRPGQFVRMAVPIETIKNATVVPESAVIDVNGQTSVFVERDGGFAALEVQTGKRSGGNIELTGGLEQGQVVVTEGAFVLKSELLLEGEE